MTIDAVVTHHTDTYSSGVARFNEILADRLGVPFLDLADPRVDACDAPLLSFKLSELTPEEHERVRTLLALPDRAPEAYLHDWEDTEAERHLVGAVHRIWAGNLAVRACLEGLHGDVRDAWTPGLLVDCRTIAPTEITVFSFGMAHKIQTEHFKRLRTLLEASGRSYALYVSSATHATSSVRVDQTVYQQMHDLFPTGLWFLGNLSDVSVYNRLLSCTYFASFFPGGVRANNTSIAAAMEQGAVCITNFDEHSPPEYRHLDNILDVARLDALPDDRLHLREMSASAMRTARGRSWDALVDHLASASPAHPGLGCRP